jgi:hypothetical protein
LWSTGLVTTAIGCMVGSAALAVSAVPAVADPSGPNSCYYADQSKCPPGTALFGPNATATAPPPPAAQDTIPTSPTAPGPYTHVGWGGVWFKTPNGQSCVIEHPINGLGDDDAKCNFVPNDGSGAQAGYNQTFASTSIAGTYQSVTQPVEAWTVLDVGKSLANGSASCTVVDPETVTCTAGAHGFTISPGTGNLW